MSATATRPGSNAEPAVTVEGLSKRYGAFVAVDAVSFAVAPGEVFGFLGPNGAGKTTTIKMLTGLVTPTSGRARVAGFDVVSERSEVKKRIGYMSQLFSLYGDLTVDENIRFFAGLYGVPPGRLGERRDWALAMAGLADAGGRLTGELSLGWKQRLALGCAVLHEPGVLFLDEPTSGVDPISRRRFWDLIYALADGGTTVFVTTHYMEEASYCHRLALMNRGKLVALDTPSGLRRAVGEPLLELDVDRPVEALAILEEAPGVLRVGLFGRHVHVTVGHVTGGHITGGHVTGGHVTVGDLEVARAALPDLLAAGGVRLAAMKAIEPSLEDVFIALVDRAGGAPTD